MMDAAGRKVDHLRISLTSRCNLDCFYCHKEGNQDIGDEMSFQQVCYTLREAEKAGIRSIKFTGGEPLLRSDIIDIIGYACSLGFEDIGLTTNGTLLDRYADVLYDAGLRRVNIGCDSLAGILPKNTEKLEKGIIAAKSTGLGVKLNMVVLNGINDKQVDGMIGFCTTHSINLQLIELIECENGYERYFYSLEDWENMLSKRADKVVVRDMQRRKRFFLGDIFIETVRPRKEFCKGCNKIRITADGRIRPCLMKSTGIIDFDGRHSLEAVCRMRDKYGYG